MEERHRHRYEVNPKYVKELEEKGLKFVGHSTDGQRMEIMELKGVSTGLSVLPCPTMYTVIDFHSIVDKFCFCNISITFGNLLQASVIGLLQNKICRLCRGSPRSTNWVQSSCKAV